MNDNRKIILNTAILYVKLVFSVLIGLYTSRVILLALGVADYGLYAVVGGVVSLMNFLAQQCYQLLTAFGNRNGKGGKR